MVYCITYDCSHKDADKNGFSFYILPKEHNPRLTSFNKLRLIDPQTLTMSVCVVNTSLRSVSLLIMQAAISAMGFKKTKQLQKSNIIAMFKATDSKCYGLLYCN